MRLTFCFCLCPALGHAGTVAADDSVPPGQDERSSQASQVRVPDVAKATSGASDAPASSQSAPARAPAPPAHTAMIDSGRAFIGHVPVNATRVGDVPLRFDVRGADLAGTLWVRYRPLGVAGGRVQQVQVQRERKGYGAILPLSGAAPPGVEYWVVERMPDGAERAVFASATDPHPLVLSYGRVREREERLLRRVEGRRSTLGVRADLVHLGAWQLPDGQPQPDPDSYWRLEAQYAYRFFEVIDELRVGLGKMEANVLRLEAEEPVGSDCDRNRTCIGLEYGRADTVLSFSDNVRARGGVLLGFSDIGFAWGVRGGLVLGPREQMELEVLGELVYTLVDGDNRLMGGSAGVRLAWFTVPGFPMGASIEVTNFPTADDAGVWLQLDAGYEIYPGALVRVLGGYRGRTSLAGGLSVGAEVQLAF